MLLNMILLNEKLSFCLLIYEISNKKVVIYIFPIIILSEIVQSYNYIYCSKNPIIS